MIAVIIFIALASLSDGSRPLGARMLRVRSAGSMPALQAGDEARCGAKERRALELAPKFGA
jgi:hypothetical protein